MAIWLFYKLDRECVSLDSICFVTCTFTDLSLFNAVLIFKILSAVKKTAAAWAALYFLIHPFHFLTLSWTFQIFTVLSTFILLHLTRLLFQQKTTSDVTKSLLYYFSLATKSFGMAMVFMPWMSSSLNRTKKIVLTIIFTMCSSYFYYLLNSGISTYAIENAESKKLIPSEHSDGDPVFLNEKNSQLPTIESSLSAVERNMIKGIVIFNNFRYYLAGAFLVPESGVINVKDTQISFTTFLSASIFLISVGYLIYSVVRIQQSSQTLRWGVFIFIFGFVPISGISYVPHFKHSFTSPHWSYLMIVGATFLFFSLVKTFEDNPFFKKCLAIYIVILLGLHMFHRYEFSDRQKYLQKNLEKVPESIMLKVLTEKEAGARQN